MLLYTYISRFSVNPHYQQTRKIRQSCRLKLYLKPFLIPIFNFSHKRPTFAFTGESGHTLGFPRRIAHKGSHAETGVFRTGVVSLPSDCFTRFGNPAWPGGRTAYFAAFGSWLDVLPKNAESLGTAMRLCASLFRGVAAPLGCVILLPLFVQYDLEGWKDLTKRSGRVTITRNNRTASRLALVWEPL